MATYAQCTYINADTDAIYGEDESPQETWTDNPGKLFRDCVKEYGRCSGKVYQDTKHGTIAVGWAFLGRTEYDDAGRMRGKDKTYLREVWVTLFEDCDPSDPAHLTRNGRPTGLRYRVIGKA